MPGEKITLSASHYLMGCRLDNWLRLLARNRLAVAPERIPQALLISLTSLLLSPFALLEAGLLAVPLRRAKLKKDPLFIVGHWRTGTTYLQNIMSHDAQFGWADPVNTITGSYSLLLGWLLGPLQKNALKGARPMDNMQYALDLPVEETFGLANVSPYSIIHCIAFPKYFQDYIPSVFVADMTERRRAEWRRSYDRLLRRISLAHGGKRLLLKSPDNTGHLRELLELYPDARVLNIHRDPYVTIMSTLNMFRKQMGLLRLSALPAGDFERLLQDAFMGIFARMYRELFELEKELPANRFADVKYEDFTASPETELRRIYDTLELDGFDEALPAFRSYIDGQRDYVKNRFTVPPELRERINRELGFYFEHYGYEIETGD